MRPVSTASRPFDHEKLDVYGAALDFISLAQGAVASFPRGLAPLADQLQRAAMSIALNTAEGRGEFSAKEKARFYRMALRSAAECAAMLDVAQRIGALSQAQVEESKQLLQRIAAMQAALIRRQKTDHSVA